MPGTCSVGPGCCLGLFQMGSSKGRVQGCELNLRVELVDEWVHACGLGLCFSIFGACRDFFEFVKIRFITLKKVF